MLENQKSTATDLAILASTTTGGTPTATVLELLANGNVGLGGNTNPAALLTLQASTNDSNGGIKLLGHTHTGDVSYWEEDQIGLQYNGAFYAVINSGAASYFNSGADYSFGTSSDLGYTLGVSGTGYFSSSLYVGGTSSGNAVCTQNGTNCPSGGGILTGTISLAASATPGVCTSGSTSISGATTSMAVVASAAVSFDTNVYVAQAFVLEFGVAQINVCTLISDVSAPTITYNIRVIP
jgi:hypothetical protein